MNFKDKLRIDAAALLDKKALQGKSGIAYGELEGRLFYAYRESSDRCSPKCSGVIPINIREQGHDAIKVYAEQHVRVDIVRQKKEQKETNHFYGNTDYPIQAVTRDGVRLIGRIVSLMNLQVELLEPFQARNDGVMFAAMASHAAGIRLTEDGKPRRPQDKYRISDWAIKEAKADLIELYKKEMKRRKNKDVIELVASLNEE
jgi:hypothetical protein